MNTVKIGDEFEDKSFQIIEKIINGGKLGIFPELCNIKRKPRYPSHRRKNGIVFDLSIEVTLPNFDKPTLLYLIECKNYSSTIPVDDVALFASYMNEIDNYAKKGIFITTSKLQSGAIEEIISHGIMLIEVNYDNYNIVFSKKDKNINLSLNEFNDVDDQVIKAIQSSILPQKIEGLKKLSTKMIEMTSCNLLNEFNPNVLNSVIETPIFELLDFLNKKDNLHFKYSDFNMDEANQILGYYNSDKNTIYINSTIKETPREKFVIAHEIGHYVLHKDLKINQTTYNNFKDPSFNFFQQKPLMSNPKNWIEWQANKFAASLILPEKSLKIMLVAIQQSMGINRRVGEIFLDKQECNKRDFRNITESLALHFGVSKINIEYRLGDLKLINKQYYREEDDDNAFFRSLTSF